MEVSKVFNVKGSLTMIVNPVIESAVLYHWVIYTISYTGHLVPIPRDIPWLLKWYWQASVNTSSSRRGISLVLVLNGLSDDFIPYAKGITINWYWLFVVHFTITAILVTSHYVSFLLVRNDTKSCNWKKMAASVRGEYQLVFTSYCPITLWHCCRIWNKPCYLWHIS